MFQLREIYENIRKNKRDVMLQLYPLRSRYKSSSRGLINIRRDRKLISRVKALGMIHRRHSRPCVADACLHASDRMCVDVTRDTLCVYRPVIWTADSG